MSLKRNPTRKILLRFCFKKGQSVTAETSWEVADSGRHKGFSVSHPDTGEKLFLSFLRKIPDFKRGAIIYEFIEV